MHKERSVSENKVWWIDSWLLKTTLVPSWQCHMTMLRTEHSWFICLPLPYQSIWVLLWHTKEHWFPFCAEAMVVTGVYNESGGLWVFTLSSCWPGPAFQRKLTLCHPHGYGRDARAKHCRDWSVQDATKNMFGTQRACCIYLALWQANYFACFGNVHELS